MPVSSFYGLQTSLRGLLAQQRSLDTTGHNIANANTAGYSRQEAVLSASPAYEVQGALANGSAALLGTGVDVLQYRRVRDEFLDLQYRAQATRTGFESARSEQLDRVETSLAEPSDDGISAQLEKFWNAWSDVANAPADPAARTALTEQGQTLGDAFKSVMDQLDTVASQASAEYDAITAPGGQVDGIVKEIGTLNDTISKFVSAGDSPNDLMDRRDVLVDQLSKLGRVSVTGGSDGMISIKFGDAADPVVDGASVNWPQTLTSPDGRLGALKAISQPGGTVDQYRATLNGVARALQSTVNGIHRRSGAGDFFSSTPGNEAATLTVAVAPSQVATGDSGLAGDNTIALDLAKLRNDPRVDGVYNAFVAQVGTEVNQAHTQEANATALSDAVDARRQSASAVSLDEEMSNVIRFQRGYQASARAMSTMDEMLDVLINRTGRVGL